PRDRQEDRQLPPQRPLLRGRRLDRWHRGAHPGRMAAPERVRGGHRGTRANDCATLQDDRSCRAVPDAVRARPGVPLRGGTERRPATHPAQAARRTAFAMSHPTEPARRARELNLFRRLGYRLFPGDTFSYVLHMRPAEWPIMAAHTALGYFLAVGFDAARLAASWTDALFGLVVWVVFLNGGTLAINTAYDRDTGDIGYLVAPPDPPRRLAAFSFALMVIGQALAFLLPPAFTITYAICFVLSILYSVPPIR